MMDINTAANIAEIGGGIAILVSLIYVGYQVRQSNRIASAAALQSVLDAFSDRQLSVYLEHPEIMGILVRGHYCYEDLPYADRTIFNSCVNREVFQMRNVSQLRGHRLINDEEYQSWLAYTVANVKTPGGRAYWVGSKAVFTREIVDCIDGYINENPDAPSVIDLFPLDYGEDAYRMFREEANT
jgi:hypothetical protein